MGTPDGLFTPDYMTRDVPMVVAELELADDQRSIVVELFNVYDTSFREALDALRTETEQVRDAYEPDPVIEEGIQRVREQMGEMRQEMREAREAFGRNRRGNESDQAAAREEGDRDQSPAGEESEEMSQEQRREQADALRAEFLERFDVLRDDMRDMQEAQIKSDQMQAMFDERMRMIREFADTKRQLRDSVESGIRALLLENQVEEWESIERTLRRNRLISRGRLSGESTDLIDILDSIELSEAQDGIELSTLVAAYEIEIDEALRQRERYDYTDALDFMDQLRKWEFDASLRNIRKRLLLQESIRDLNDQYIEAISAVLPPLEREEFRRQGLMKGYSRIFRPTRVERVLVNAMEIEDLDPDVLESVAELIQAHSDEIVVANEDLLMILRQEDSNSVVERAEDRIYRMQGLEREDDEFDPMREAFDSREKIDERYLATLESLLTPEQFEAIAGRRGRDGERQGRRGGRDRGESSREEFMKQFDRNGDGELDEEERNAMREQFRQRRGGGGRQQGPPPGEV
tara:strand:+ start:73 stop:1635 length:1563 start_codon:yes stop_codon:yes gene_type:complete